MALEVEHPVASTKQVGLVDDGDGFPDFDQFVEILDVLGVKTHAAVANPHADARGLVGTVDQVAGQSQLQYPGTQGIVRPRRHLLG